MSLNMKQAEVVEILIGTHWIDHDFAVKIAELTYGDMTKAPSAVSDYKRGWTKEQVIESLNNLIK
ncbi:hypothetical protein ABEX29_02710 [Brevibacillus porteri]|uniref:hypothetical protein n=1 Tax=Brevibacillus porteri TaxID=2126350 RepID=UPI003D2065A8